MKRVRNLAAASYSSGFPAIAKQAKGQTVRWWLYGGDDKVNAYVDDVVAPAARKLGVQIRRVPVTDIADALQRVVAERRAGKTSGGAVDLIWINGENFATGKQPACGCAGGRADCPTPATSSRAIPRACSASGGCGTPPRSSCCSPCRCSCPAAPWAAA